ncbi:MAG: hypothetical protein P8O70_20440 [SAR324 cluster bacterium]|nr:hypothetical protein [SAR324 cluster bacterium]
MPKIPSPALKNLPVKASALHNRRFLTYSSSATFTARESSQFSSLSIPCSNTLSWMILRLRIGKSGASNKSLIRKTLQKRNHSISFLLVGPERSDQLKLEWTLSTISSILRNALFIDIQSEHCQKPGMIC